VNPWHASDERSVKYGLRPQEAAGSGFAARTRAPFGGLPP